MLTFNTGWVAIGLFAVAVACKSTGALVLLGVGALVLWLVALMRTTVPALILVAIPIVFLSQRSTGWSGNDF